MLADALKRLEIAEIVGLVRDGDDLGDGSALASRAMNVRAVESYWGLELADELPEDAGHCRPGEPVARREDLLLEKERVLVHFLRR